MENTISVIIPTHNRSLLLRRALQSVTRQTLQPQEIIVVDDGSTDDTAAMLHSEFPAVIHIQQKQLGVSAARNHGIRQAKGEWIAFLDSDDEWLPEKLQMQMAALSAAAGGVATYLLCHSDEIWIRHGRRVNPMKKHQKYGGWIFRHCLPLCVISPSSAILHRTLFETVGLFDEQLPACEDYDLWLRICARYPVLFIDTALIIKYGGHADQLSHKYWGMDRFRVYALDRLLQHQSLTSADYDAALAEIRKKIRVLKKGGLKRGNQELLTELIPIEARWG